MSTKTSYSLFKGITKQIQVLVVLSIATLLVGLKPEIKELTLGGILLWLRNYLKVRWDIKIPFIE